VLDQSFSTQNFYTIYKQENKKGQNVTTEYFPDAAVYNLKIKKLRQLISKSYSKRRYSSSRWFESRISNLYLLLKLLKNKRNEIVLDNLHDISSLVSSPKADFKIIKSPEKINDKYVYFLDNTAESYFTEKQIQRNIKYTYQVKQNDRDLIIPQLKFCLNNKYPMYIIRTDIKSFYETVDRKMLLTKLNQSSVLSLASRKIIAKLLRSYGEVSGEENGIPRGLGISAYLSELYLKDFDYKIKKISNLIYYARYVDDIVLVISPHPTDNKENYLELIKEFLSDDNLSINTDEEKTALYSIPSENYDFDYLGYKFKKNGSRCGLSISDNKNDKYIAKANKIIDKYNKSWVRTPKKSKRDLLLRLRFITSNTRLFNNKGNAVVGIYNSNKWVTDTKFLTFLDGQLCKAISRIENIALRKKLMGKHKFAIGFENREFVNFSAKEFSIISKGWK
jgi:hypothetical protein